MRSGQATVTKKKLDKLKSQLIKAEVTAAQNNQTEEVDRCHLLQAEVNNMVESQAKAPNDQKGEQKVKCESEPILSPHASDLGDLSHLAEWASTTDSEEEVENLIHKPRNPGSGLKRKRNSVSLSAAGKKEEEDVKPLHFQPRTDVPSKKTRSG